MFLHMGEINTRGRIHIVTQDARHRTVLGRFCAREGSFAEVFSLPGWLSPFARAPLDIHYGRSGRKCDGAEIDLRRAVLYAKASRRRLKGAVIISLSPSVGATENIMIGRDAAPKAPTFIKQRRPANPRIVGTSPNCLRRMGAQIRGRGTSTLHPFQRRGPIWGDRPRNPVVTDRIELGTYISPRPSGGGEVRIAGGPLID